MASRAKRRFAQHFLEPSWVGRLIQVIKPRTDETFLEIGAGRGALTLPLSASGARVLAVEIDRALVPSLRRQVPANVTVISGDFLELDLDRLVGQPPDAVRVVGNLPYSVGVPILVKVLRFSGNGARFRDATVMLQREVADRVTAEPGSRDWGPLAVVVRLHADATRALTIPPGAFRPIPKVHSAVVTLRFRPPPVTLGDPELFDRIVRSIFTHRRKMAVNALRPLAAQLSRVPCEQLFERAGVDPGRRPGQLELAELAELSEVLASTRT